MKSKETTKNMNSFTSITLLMTILIFTASIHSTTAKFSDGDPTQSIPEFGNGWGSGSSGGGSWSGTTRSSIICTIRGPCYKKKLTCPAKCFKAWSRSGKNFGGGGGGGGCTMDCKKCVAYC